MKGFKIRHSSNNKVVTTFIEEFKKDSRIVWKKEKKKKWKKMPTYFQTTDEFTERNLKVILVPRATGS